MAAPQADLDQQVSASGQPAEEQSLDHDRPSSVLAQPTNGRTGSNTNHTQKKSRAICRFYATKKGCRAGDQCPYRHVQIPASNLPVEPIPTSPVIAQDGPQPPVHASSDAASGGPAAGRTSRSNLSIRPVAKPVSVQQQANPREFAINQVVKRFSGQRSERDDGTTMLTFNLVPSDPDFPFELSKLQSELTIPQDYPKGGKPSLRVRNADMPRGYQINVEKGYDTLISKSGSLLSSLNALDRSLETFLSSEKTQTVKIIANTTKKVPEHAEASQALPSQVSSAQAVVAPSYTNEQKSRAKQKRDADVRQLDARMSRMSLYSKLSDGKTFNVPLAFPKPAMLPPDLQSVKEATLNVPLLYNLEPCTLHLKGVSGPDVEKVEMAFERFATGHKDMTLMALINHLTQNMHNMAKETSAVVHADPVPAQTLEKLPGPNTPSPEPVTSVDPDRPHLQRITRPPEWDKPKSIDGNDEDSSESYDSDEDYSEDESEDEEPGGIALTSTTAVEKGILFSFPHLELYGIELFQVQSLSLTIKCDRCKDTMDVKNIQPHTDATSSTRTESCHKCSAMLSLSYRAELMHANSIKAGYLDLEGCTVVDMLPSNFAPTCAECSTTYSNPGVVSVRGETSLAVCRECHKKMTFKIPEIKFLRVSSNDGRINRPMAPKKKKENLGISAGTELPLRGKCKHYSKSYRWFRFSCCNKVYACDRCHDEKEEHPNEHANRMICGYCSREQNYRPEDCQVCGRNLVGKRGGGFWEGGKGTRDKARMSRKDPRKYKRRGPGAKVEGGVGARRRNKEGG